MTLPDSIHWMVATVENGKKQKLSQNSASFTNIDLKLHAVSESHPDVT